MLIEDKLQQILTEFMVDKPREKIIMDKDITYIPLMPPNRCHDNCLDYTAKRPEWYYLCGWMMVYDIPTQQGGFIYHTLITDGKKKVVDITERHPEQAHSYIFVTNMLGDPVQEDALFAIHSESSVVWKNGYIYGEERTQKIIKSLQLSARG